MSKNRDTILVLDFGSPYTEFITKKVREIGVYSEILPFNTSLKEILRIDSLKGIILSDGPVLIDEKKVFLPYKKLFKLGIPILGINYGALVLSYLLKGKVKFSQKRQFLKTEVFIDDFTDILFGLPANFTCELCPEEEISKLPYHFKSLAHTLTQNYICISEQKKKIYGIRFHPLIFEGPKGGQILANFLFRICGCKKLWRIESFIKEKNREIKEIVGKSKVILKLNGDLNSVVCAILIHKAIGRNLKCIFIDNGFFLGDDRISIIKKFLKTNFHLNLVYLEKGGYFLSKLKNVILPKEKKRILETEASLIFENEIKKIKNLRFIAMSTLYSDLIESKEKKDKEFKILSLKRLKIIEPLKELFDDEVKRIAEIFGLPQLFIHKRFLSSFEIPLRIEGEVTDARLKILREAEIIISEEIRKLNIAKIQEVFATLIPLASNNILVIHCLSSLQDMDLEWTKLPYEVLEKISKRIINEVKGIDRIAYDISPKLSKVLKI